MADTKDNEEQEINIDRLSDDDIDSILAEIERDTYEDDPEDTSNDDNSDDSGYDSDDNGSEDDNADNSGSDESDDDNEDLGDEDESEYSNENDDANANDNEDTDQDDDSDEDDDTTGEGDDTGSDTSDEDDDDSEENSPVDSTDDNKDEKDAETKDQDGDSDDDTVKLDQSEFEKYKDFYEKVANAEFKANGKTVKGFSDPEKIIQAQQMSYGFSDKMAGFKKYRPFLDPLQKNGMIDDPDKFNLAMDIISGDKEAIKKHIKDLELDPVVDLDMENLAYSGKNHVSSKETLALEDAMDAAKNLGVENKVREVIGKQWDDESFNEFVQDPDTRRDLINHMSTEFQPGSGVSVYDKVQEKISEIKRLDFNGDFGSMKSTDQYRTAIMELRRDMQNNASHQEPVKRNADNTDNEKVEAEKARIIKEREQAEYKAKAEQEKRKADQQRRKASTVSKKKTKTKAKPSFDPLKLKGDDLDAFVDSLIDQGRT